MSSDMRTADGEGKPPYVPPTITRVHLDPVGELLMQSTVTYLCGQLGCGTTPGVTCK